MENDFAQKYIYFREARRNTVCYHFFPTIISMVLLLSTFLPVISYLRVLACINRRNFYYLRYISELENDLLPGMATKTALATLKKRRIS